MKNFAVFGIMIIVASSLAIPLLAYSIEFVTGPTPIIPNPNISEYQQNKMNDALLNVKPEVIFASVGTANTTEGENASISFSLVINLELEYKFAAKFAEDKPKRNEIRQYIQTNGNSTYIGYFKLAGELYPIKPTLIDESIGSIQACIYSNESYSNIIGNISVNTTTNNGTGIINNKTWYIYFSNL